MSSFNTILFDLDGTLLPIDGQAFEKIYFGNLSKHFLDVYEPKMLIQLIWGATKIMVKDTSDRTNEVVFMESLEKLVGSDITWMQERFARFYETNFDQLRTAVTPNENVLEAVRILKEKGYQCVIVTNPMFPKIAIEKRIAWTGLNRDDFSYVTSFEKNTACKPQLKLYEEVLSELGLQVEDCLMVGNDIEEDMIVAQMGMDHYLITDHVMQEDVIPDFVKRSGDYVDFLNFVKELKPL